FRAVRQVKPSAATLSLTHRLENHPLGPLAVPLAIEDPLPRAEVEAAVRDRYDHLVADGDGPQMRRRVVLARAAVVPVPIRIPRRDGMLQPLEDVAPPP